jgi:hypothetical protein
MIIRTEEFKDVGSKILAAVDSNELSTVTETLELKVEGRVLFISVTNREYFAQVKINVDDEFDFHATVNANLFLKLVSQITTETIELKVVDNYLLMKGNGTYKIPLIFDDEKLLELPRIEIENKVKEFDIDSDILKSILTYNSKELLRGITSMPVQKLFYIDEQGCITFTTGACVNSFTLPEPIKILINNRLVKLFKLFKNGAVKFTLGFDPISDEIIQTKVRFQSDDISITAIISCDDTMLTKVPVNAIRGRANNAYPYSINLNKNAIIQTINRLMLFNGAGSGKEVLKPFSKFEFHKDKVIIYDVHEDNCESVFYMDTTLDLEEPYTANIDLGDMKATLESCMEDYLTMHFGDQTAIVVSRGHVKNVIPECTVE